MRTKSLLERRWQLFKGNRRAVVSGVFLLLLSFFSLTAEFWSNDRPLVLYHSGKIYFPVFKDYSPKEFGLSGTMVVDYRNLPRSDADRALWPLNRWDPYRTNKLAKEFPAAPSADNWLGTDDRGRDVFARLLYGFRYSLIFSITVWFICSLIALLYGGMCGFLGRWVDLLGQRATEILSTVPQLLLLIFVLSIFEPSLTILVTVSCAFGWIGLSYFVRGEVLRTRGLDYVEAARALGASRRHILFQCILPNCVVPLITFAPFMIVANLTGLAGLDFLGLGLPAPTPSWGELLQQAQAYFSWAWWLAFFPAFALFLTLLSLTLLGEGVREAFDPNAKLAPTLEAKERQRSRVRKALRRLREQSVAAAAVPAVKAGIIIALLAGAAFVTAARADDDDHNSGLLKIETTNQTASDPVGMKVNRLSFNSGERESWVSSFAATAEVVNGDSDFMRFEATKVQASASFPVRPYLSLTIGGGYHRLSNRYPPDGEEDEDNSDIQDEEEEDEEEEAAFQAGDLQQGDIYTVEKTIPYYSLNLWTSTQPEIWELNLLFTNDFIYQEWMAASAASDFVTSRRLTAEFGWTFFPRWRARLNGVYGRLADGNTEYVNDSAVLYTLLDSRHTVLVGPGVYATSFTRFTETYWSPSLYAVYMIKTESTLRWSDQFSTSVNVNVGHGGERGGESGLDYFLETKLNYSLHSVTLAVGWANTRSLRSDNWRRSDVNFTLSADL